MRKWVYILNLAFILLADFRTFSLILYVNLPVTSTFMRSVSRHYWNYQLSRWFRNHSKFRNPLTVLLYFWERKAINKLYLFLCVACLHSHLYISKKYKKLLILASQFMNNRHEPGTLVFSGGMIQYLGLWTKPMKGHGDRFRRTKRDVNPVSSHTLLIRNNKLRIVWCDLAAKANRHQVISSTNIINLVFNCLISDILFSGILNAQ